MKKVLTTGALSLDVLNRVFVADEGAVHLGFLECKALELLMTHEGIVIVEEMLYFHLHDTMKDPLTTVVELIVQRLRRKLSSCGCAGWIETVWGQGYVFRAPDAGPRALMPLVRREKLYA